LYAARCGRPAMERADRKLLPPATIARIKAQFHLPAERTEITSDLQTRITPDLARFIEAQTSIFLATANAEGQPYIQHRGGPPGFLKLLDDKTLGLAEFAGNRQYITQGNLMDNPKAHLFLIDYTQRKRIKIWGKARIVEDNTELYGEAYIRRLQGTPRTANPIHRFCLDANCPQHIPQRFEAATSPPRSPSAINASRHWRARSRDERTFCTR